MNGRYRAHAKHPATRARRSAPLMGSAATSLGWRRTEPKDRAEDYKVQRKLAV